MHIVTVVGLNLPSLANATMVHLQGDPAFQCDDTDMDWSIADSGSGGRV